MDDKYLGSYGNYYYFKEEPYQPFYELLKSLKKWPFFRLYDTDHWGNRVLSWLAKAQGNVLHCPKSWGPFVWMPKATWGTKRGYVVLMHEGEHAKDFWKFGGPLMMLSQYILPYGPSFIALYEYRAYCKTMEADYNVYGNVFDSDAVQYAAVLNSKPYKYAFPWPKIMERWFRKAQARIIKDGQSQRATSRQERWDSHSYL